MACATPLFESLARLRVGSLRERREPHADVLVAERSPVRLLREAAQQLGGVGAPLFLPAGTGRGKNLS
jgi:transcriptional regulator of aromatic amino acid metabolism